MSEGVISPANAVKDVGEEPTKKRFIVVFCLFIGIFIACLLYTSDAADEL